MRHWSGHLDLLVESTTNLVQAGPLVLKSHCAIELERGDQMGAMEELMARVINRRQTGRPAMMWRSSTRGAKNTHT